MFKTTIKKVAAIFEPQKPAVRANDLGIALEDTQLLATVTPLDPQPQEPTVAATPVEKPAARALPNLSALRNSGLKARAPVPKVAVTAAPAIAPAPAPKIAASAPLVAATPEIAKTPTVEIPAAQTVAAIASELSRMDIEAIVRAYIEQHAPAAAQTIETAPGLEYGEIPGSRKAIYIAPVTFIPVDPASGLDASETAEQIQARLDADLAAAVADRSRRPISSQVAITFSKPTGRDTWSRR